MKPAVIAILAALALSACDAGSPLDAAPTPDFSGTGVTVVQIDSSKWSVGTKSCDRTEDVAGHQLDVAECSYSDVTGSYDVVDAVLSIDGRGATWCVRSCGGGS